MRKLVCDPAASFSHSPNWLRQNRETPEFLREIDLLGDSLEIRQEEPITADLQRVVENGNRRLMAALRRGRPEKLWAMLTDEPIDSTEMQFVTDLHAALEQYEQYLLCSRWKQEHPDRSAKELAARIGRDPSLVSEILSLSRCVPEVVEAAKAGRIGATDWAVISRVDDPQAQRVLLTAKLAGATRDDLRRSIRKYRTPSSDAPKVSRLKCQLSGASISFAASGGLSLDGIVDLLSELLKEAKRANDSGITAKTWEKTLRDRHSHD